MTGALSFVAAPDFRAPTDAGATTPMMCKPLRQTPAPRPSLTRPPVAANATATGYEHTVISGALSATDADVLIGFGAGQVRVITDNVDAFDENDFIF